MNRVLFSFLLLTLFSFSSCFHRAATDVDADDALGLGSQVDAAVAQQELESMKKEQLEEQQRQIDRQITDPLNPEIN